MWRIGRRRSLLVANCHKKLSSTKTIWPVMQARRFSVCRTLFHHPQRACEWLLFFRWNPMNYCIFFKCSCIHIIRHFTRKLKMFKITAYIQLYYEILFFYVAMLVLVNFLSLLFFFDNSQRVLFQYYFLVSSIIKVATQSACVMGSAVDKRWLRPS